MVEGMLSAGGLTIQDLESLRATLMSVRVANLADLETARSTMSTLLADGTAASPSLREDVANAEYMIEDASAILAMIDAALLRMDDGTYGTCVDCHQQIPLPRLELRPYGPKCVTCAS
jgi:DnaK suppressor protein